MVIYSTEMFGSKNGIATWVILHADLFRMEGAFAGLLVLIVLAISILSAIEYFDNRLRPWKGEVSD